MSGTTDLTKLIERMERAIDEVREVTRDAHAATKDLRQVVKEARAILGSTEVDARIEQVLNRGLGELGDSFGVAIEAATDAVYRRFDTIGTILLGEDGSGESIETLIRRRQGEPR